VLIEESKLTASVQSSRRTHSRYARIACDMFRLFASPTLARRCSLRVTKSVTRFARSKFCDQQQYIPRTWDRILEKLSALNSDGLLPDLSLLAGLKHRGDAGDPKMEDRDDGNAVVEQE